MKRITVSSTLTTLATVCFFIIILSGKRCDECFSAPVMMAKFIACGLVIFIGSLYFTRLFLKNEKRIFEIETLPLLETDEAVEGVPFSGEGTVEVEDSKLLTSPYTGLPCVYYHSITEELRGSGKSRHWEVIENLVNFSPFYLTDERGKLKVDPTNMDGDFSGFEIANDHLVPDPDNSEIDCTRVLDKSTTDTGWTVAVTWVPISSSGTVRRSEFILPPLCKIFVYGFVTKKNDELILREHPLHPLLISQKTKEAFVDEFYKGHALVFLVHILISVGFTIVVLAADYFLREPSVLLMTILVAGNGVLVFSMLFTIYNRLVTLSVRARNAQYDIDVELKRRADLIPKVTDLVKAYSAYEREVQTLTAQMRSHITYVSSVPESRGVPMIPLIAIAEKYPEMTADKNFLRLMRTLKDTEERIAYARAFYNRNVRKLNTLVRQLPFSLVAGLCGISEMPFITIDKGDTESPKVS